MNSWSGFAWLATGIWAVATGLRLHFPLLGGNKYKSLPGALAGAAIGSLLIAVGIVFIVTGVTS